MTSKTEFTIKKLLSEFIVNVPAIQRDYAFGRQGDINADKRQSFIKSLSGAVLGNRKTHLDFIYGKTEGEIFIPLDGQQRITTLWLINLYIGKKNDQVPAYLKNFTYDTRTSTREFCVALIEEDWDLARAIDSFELYLSEQKWFFNSWKYDPTISGMCVVLSEIHKVFKGLKESDLQSADIENVTFSFLDIRELGQPEELYVKMNSRGKQLSDWDIFKADLFEYIAEQKWEGFDIEDLELWVDRQFLDFFWSIGSDGEDKAENTESRMFRFWRLLFFVDAIEGDSLMAESSNEVKNIEKAEEIKEKISNNWKSFVTNDFVNRLEKFIVFLDEYEDEIDAVDFGRFKSLGLRLEDLRNIFRKNHSNQDFMVDVDLFYAYYRFALNNSETDELNVDELEQVIRITTNFEEPYRKEFSVTKPFIKAMQGAIDYNGGILKYFAETDLSQVRFGARSDEQKWEEVEKAKLVLRCDEWRENIYSAEKHEYFNGTIGWLLRIAEGDNAVFEAASSNLLGKFNENGILERETIAEILKYKDIRIDKFLPRNSGDSAKDLYRDKSWKRLFRECGYSKVPKDIVWIKDWLTKAESQEVFDWRKWFFACPKLLSIGRIGAVKDLNYGDNRLFGITWDKGVFSAVKYDIPLLTLKLSMDGVVYEPFNYETMPTSANYKDKEITFDHENDKYVIDGTEAIDAKDVDIALDRVRIALRITE